VSDFERLLAPLALVPAGPDLRYVNGDTTLRRIEQLRVPSPPEPGSGAQPRPVDWAVVATECETVLAQRSKDLQVAAYLTEALARRAGFPGLAHGLWLVRNLTERFWEELHPGRLPDGGLDPAIRAKWLSWLGSSAAFLRSCKEVPITQGGDGRAPSWFDYEESQRVDQAQLAGGEKWDELRAAGKINGKEWRAALNATHPQDRERTLAGLVECRGELDSLIATCDRLLGGDAPSFGKLRDLLEECHGYLAGAWKGGVGDGSEKTAPDGVASSEGPMTSGRQEGAGPALGPVTTRVEAYQRIREVAEFLRRTEPHSPVPPLLERVARWEHKFFDDVFRDVVKSEEIQRQVWEVLGLERKDEGQ
jgi:type VI secretion system protein ImpA